VSYKQSPVYRAGIWSDTMEIAVPWSKLDAVYRAVRRALSGHALVMAHMSHAYPDGCSVYFTFLGVSRGPDPGAEHAAAWSDAIDATLEAGGVSSHHHGVGRLRKEALHRELGPGGSEAFGALKRAWDPSGIMNPGSPFEPPAAASPRAAEIATNGAGWLLDEHSGLIALAGDAHLDVAERALRERGLTTGLDAPPSTDVNGWVASGMPGLPDAWLDPVEQRLAGLDAVLASGARLHLRPAPRRATGPDLGALFVGAESHIGRVERIWLRAKPWTGERNPAMSAAEERAFETLVSAFRPRS
jgi:alkyldihydroxyacetonephosphate synthase